MDDCILREYNDFKKYHKHKFNIIFHAFCGIMYMTFFFLLFNTYSIPLLILYSIIILFTFKNTFIIISQFLILLILIKIFTKYLILDKYIIIILMVLFYLLPELSHYILNEKTVLNISNITLSNIVINIYYLLPFSMRLLFNS
jgi:hypothetical protein